jgi:hypothetical protein
MYILYHGRKHAVSYKSENFGFLPNLLQLQLPAARLQDEAGIPNLRVET